MSFLSSDLRAAAQRDWLDAQWRMSGLPSYYRWTMSLVRRHVGRRVLEVGCGIGNFTAHLADECDYVAAADNHPAALAAARKRLLGRPNVEFFELDLDSGLGNVRGAGFDAIVCLDVIEHVEHDEAALRLLKTFARPGGCLIVKAPACPALYGEVDRASGHQRRYTAAGLAEVAGRAGWKTVSRRHMNACGLIPYWFASRVLRRRANFSRTFSQRQWRLVRAMVPIARAIDIIIGPPIGQSVILVAQRESDSHGASGPPPACCATRRAAVNPGGPSGGPHPCA